MSIEKPVVGARRAAQPFTFEGGACANTGVLILHGFTGSPAEMRPLGLALHRSGYTVHGALQPRHGGLAAALRGARYAEWIDAAFDGLARLDACERVFVAGLSMGGLVTLHLAALAGGFDPALDPVRRDRLKRLSGILVLSAPMRVNDWRIGIVRYARHFVRWHMPTLRFDDPETRDRLRTQAGGDALDLDDPATRRRLRQLARIPLDAIDQLLRLNGLAVQGLHRITVPALFMQGRRDRTVTADSAERLRAGVGSMDASVVWFERSAHVLTTDAEKEDVCAAAVAFVRRLSR